MLFAAKLVAGEGSPELKEKPFNTDVEQFSSFTKLCRATAWVIRFIEKLRKKTNLSGPLKSTEISKAETMRTAYVHHTEYSNIIDSISKEKSNNLRTQLGLCMENNGLIRCKGRPLNILYPVQCRATEMTEILRIKESSRRLTSRMLLRYR